MEITKKYYFVRNEAKLITGINAGNCKVETNFTVYQNDDLQTCINELFNNNINSFEIPVVIEELPDVPKYYKKEVFRTEIVSYKEKEPVYAENLFVGYNEMTVDEKNAVSKNDKAINLNWQEDYKTFAIRLRVKITDTLTGGVLEQKANDMLKLRNPFHKFADEYFDVYLSKINDSDVDLITAYLTENTDCHLINLNDI